MLVVLAISAVGLALQLLITLPRAEESYQDWSAHYRANATELEALMSDLEAIDLSDGESAELVIGAFYDWGLGWLPYYEDEPAQCIRRVWHATLSAHLDVRDAAAQRLSWTTTKKKVAPSDPSFVSGLRMRSLRYLNAGADALTEPPCPLLRFTHWLEGQSRAAG